MRLREIKAKTIISKSGVYDYTLNPYVGCGHGCVYCYARFMKKWTGHAENWGDFADAKITAPELLEKEAKSKKIKRVWMSGVCDPYQPVEKKYGLARKCLEIFAKYGWPVTIQTKSPLVLRDIDILGEMKNPEVCFSIATADEKTGEMFEPRAPAIGERIKALGILNSAGIGTSVMIAPLLPGFESLPELLKGKVKRVLVDRMNYNYADSVYKRHGLEYARKDGFFAKGAETLKAAFEKDGIDYKVLF